MRWLTEALTRRVIVSAGLRSIIGKTSKSLISRRKVEGFSAAAPYAITLRNLSELVVPF